MNSFNIDAIVKAVVGLVLLSMSLGQFHRLRDFALQEGIRAVKYNDYRPTHFFPRESRQ